MKYSKDDIRKMILEEMQNYDIHEDAMGSTSLVEIEELLLNYFRENGIPENIGKLSVLFPILEKVGLGSVVDVYKETRKTNPEAAKNVLVDIKEVIKNIKAKGMQ